MHGYINGYFEKNAGWKSEWLSPMRYIPYLSALGAAGGGAVALTTDTDDQQKSIERDEDMWKNLLIPGYADYNMMKRIGQGARGKEIIAAKKAIRAEIESLQDEGYTKREAIAKIKARLKSVVQEGASQEKQANVWTENIGMLNPLSWLALPVSMVIAMKTPTRSTEQQALHDVDTSNIWKDLLVPGKAPYNIYKRYGYAYRNPEKQELKREARAAKRKEDKKDKK
jgi:hypothetical protein